MAFLQSVQSEEFSPPDSCTEKLFERGPPNSRLLLQRPSLLFECRWSIEYLVLIADCRSVPECLVKQRCAKTSTLLYLGTDQGPMGSISGAVVGGNFFAIALPMFQKINRNRVNLVAKGQCRLPEWVSAFYEAIRISVCPRGCPTAQPSTTSRKVWKCFRKIKLGLEKAT